MNFNNEKIGKTLKNKGYAFFEDGEFNVNIIGVRNSATGKRVTNAFDDWMTLSYKENGVWKYHEWACTTDNGAGTARVVEGQYRGSHGIGLHQGKYEALKQFKSVKVFRDADRNMTYAENKVDEGIFGINIHKAGADSTYVENWSEGCQVFKRVKDFEEFMTICRKARDIHGNSFTYTLIESADIK